MFNLRSILVLMVTQTLVGCALGPLVSQEAGRTVGDGNHEFQLGYGSAQYFGKYTWGLTENLDFGVQYEAFSLGIRLKYAFINNREAGFALAVAGGTGASIGGSHQYIDVLASHLIGEWEPYVTIRYVWSKVDPVEFTNKDTGQVDFRTPNFNYSYGHFFVGTRYWITKKWLLAIEGSGLFLMSSGLNVSQPSLIAGSVGYRF